MVLFTVHFFDLSLKSLDSTKGSRHPTTPRNGRLESGKVWFPGVFYSSKSSLFVRSKYVDILDTIKFLEILRSTSEKLLVLLTSSY